MLKIPNVSQIRELDAHTIREQKLKSIDLMERACQGFTNWFTARFDNHQTTGIICGPGNNGGDGLGIARMLHAAGYPVKVWKVTGPVKDSEDCRINLERLRSKTAVADFTEQSPEHEFQSCQILIDAIFGSGLSREPEGNYRHAIRCMNAAKATRISVDIPSGLFADKRTTGDVVHADHTVSFQLPKLAFMFPENHRFVGSWNLIDIGLSKSFIKTIQTPYRYITKKSVRKVLRFPAKFDHKGDHGRGLLISGSRGKMGACILASRAAIRTGLGLLTAHVPGCGYTIIQSAVPEAMASVDKDENCFTAMPPLEPYNVIGIGPGLGTGESTALALRATLHSGKPMVIDADALNMLGQHKEWLNELGEGTVLTPHPKEFERLAGNWRGDFERLSLQTQVAQKTKAIVVLKGAHTSIATPDGRVYFNSTGNPGMATGGSGDVLTGILTGLLGRGYSPKWAAIMGVFVHGLAGDLASRHHGRQGLIASDLIDFLPRAFKSLE